jgi:hypothetical protein
MRLPLLTDQQRYDARIRELRFGRFAPDADGAIDHRRPALTPTTRATPRADSSRVPDSAADGVHDSGDLDSPTKPSSLSG